MSLATSRVVIACLCAGVLAAVGCAAGPTSPGASTAVVSLANIEPGTIATSVSPRSGDLHVTKDCDKTYNFQAGDFCTITSSNVAAIPVGSKILYIQAAGIVAPFGFAQDDKQDLFHLLNTY